MSAHLQSSITSSDNAALTPHKINFSDILFSVL